LNAATNKLKLFKWAIAIVGIIFIVICKFSNEGSGDYFAYGFLFLSFAFSFEIYEELHSGIAKVSYGNDTIEKQKQPFIYWSVILIHLLFLIYGITVAYVIHRYS